MITEDTVAAIAKSVRGLSIDAVERAGSGHPGLPLGLAELGAVLYGGVLRHYPGEPQWVNRDRFVLSAGHGSMLLYSLLSLAGFGLEVDELKEFRQLGTRVPGHPEWGRTPGVETTTGPLGQGLGNAVGMAVAETHLRGCLAAGSEGSEGLVDHYTYCIVGDGDLMEGVTSEASSLAGHLQLGKLIVFFDDNHITIEGDTGLATSENIEQRYAAYGWQVLSASAYDVPGLLGAVKQAQSELKQPTLIRCSSVIGKGAPTKAGTAGVHGSPLGASEHAATRAALGISGDFAVEPAAAEHFAQLLEKQKQEYTAWGERLAGWLGADTGNRALWESYFGGGEGGAADAPWRKKIAGMTLPNSADAHPMATRASGGKVLQAVAAELPSLIGGSADLAPSNNTALPYGDFSAGDPTGRTIHFGVREHAMGAVCNGLVLHGGVRGFCATFLVFTDYMRPSMRLAAYMGLGVIYVMTHDSIYVGEDGPTHQPVEQIAALRSIPNMEVWRPADGNEAAEAWRQAVLHTSGPSVLALSRQKLPLLLEDADGGGAWREDFANGAYIVRAETGELKTIIVATGSEVSMAVAGAELRGAGGVRVVSMPCRDRFEAAPEEYRRRILPEGVRVIVAEAGVRSGWEHYVQHCDDLVVMSGFGESGKAADVAEHFGMTAERLAKLL